MIRPTPAVRSAARKRSCGFSDAVFGIVATICRKLGTLLASSFLRQWAISLGGSKLAGSCGTSAATTSFSPGAPEAAVYAIHEHVLHLRFFRENLFDASGVDEIAVSPDRSALAIVKEQPAVLVDAPPCRPCAASR